MQGYLTFYITTKIKIAGKKKPSQGAYIVGPQNAKKNLVGQLTSG
jgi:hypothetical protein